MLGLRSDDGCLPFYYDPTERKDVRISGHVYWGKSSPFPRDQYYNADAVQVIGEPVKTEALGWESGFPGSHEWFRTGNNLEAGVFIIKPKDVTQKGNTKRPAAPVSATSPSSKRLRRSDDTDPNADARSCTMVAGNSDAIRSQVGN